MVRNRTCRFTFIKEILACVRKASPSGPSWTYKCTALRLDSTQVHWPSISMLHHKDALAVCQCLLLLGHWYLQNFFIFLKWHSCVICCLINNCEAIRGVLRAVILSILKLSLLLLPIGLPFVSSIVLMMDVEHYHDWHDVNNYVRHSLHSIENADPFVLEEEVLPEEVKEV